MNRPDPKDYSMRKVMQGVYENDLEAYIDYLESKNWISVKERLPDQDVKVLVVDRHGNMGTRYLKNAIPLWYPDGMPVNWTTHWMELPELPKE